MAHSEESLDTWHTSFHLEVAWSTNLEQISTCAKGVTCLIDTSSTRESHMELMSIDTWLSSRHLDISGVPGEHRHLAHEGHLATPRWARRLDRHLVHVEI